MVSWRPALSYTDADGNITQNKPDGVELSDGVQTTAAWLHHFNAQGERTPISCKIYLNGDLVTQNTSTGKYTVVTCAARR